MGTAGMAAGKAATAAGKMFREWSSGKRLGAFGGREEPTRRTWRSWRRRERRVQAIEDLSRRPLASRERRLPKKLLSELLHVGEQIIIHPRGQPAELRLLGKVGGDHLTRVSRLCQAPSAHVADDLALVCVGV